MADWTEGYVSDIEYQPGFYAEQTPAHLDIVCLLRAVEPPRRPGASFRYCELGCGLADTALTIAAANPHAEVMAFDFNPAHIARATALATEAGLANIHLEEASFEDLVSGDRRDLGMFDYIVLHGVWAWVSAANRSHIVTFIRRHLKPGGLAQVTYNALPGWTPAMPMQRLFSMYASGVADRSDKRIVGAIDVAQTFARAGSPAISAEFLERVIKVRDEGKLAYLSHEYLNEHWSPFYQMDVARDLAGAKLGFVGTAMLFENFPDLCLSAEQREIVDNAPAALRETVTDYFMNRPFRRDVYARGPRRIPDSRLDALIRSLRLALVVPDKAITRSIKVPLGEASLSERFYAPALDALREAPRTIGELIDLAEVAGSTVTPREVLGMLVGSRQARVISNDVTAEGRTAAMRYNRVRLGAAEDEERGVGFLAAAGTGSGHGVPLFGKLVYQALCDGIPAEAGALAEAVRKTLAIHGFNIREHGEMLEDKDAAGKIIAEQVAAVVAEEIPIWRRIGAI